MKNREDQRNKTKVDNSVNVFGEKFLDKYSVNIRDQIEKFNNSVLLLTFMVKILFLGNFPEYDVSLY
ncbi:unknown [Akkermansia muciniphila CAG:154]|nr:unknown [Akkermansia muciniphila CAG:154]